MHGKFSAAIEAKDPYGSDDEGHEIGGVCWFRASEFADGDRGDADSIPDEVFDLMAGETIALPGGGVFESDETICRFKTTAAAKIELQRAFLAWAERETKQGKK